MTISSTATFDETAQQICVNALVNLGAIGIGEAPPAELLVHARSKLNVLVKSIDKEGPFTWRTVRRTLPTISGTTAYPLGADVKSLQPYARYIRPGQTSGILLWPLGAREFMELPDRTIQGTPVQFWPEKRNRAVTLNLWPIPNEVGVVEYSAALWSADMARNDDTPDFPPEWLRCLEYGLSADMAPAYGQAATPFGTVFETELAKLVGMNTEEQAPLTFVVGQTRGW